MPINRFSIALTFLVLSSPAAFAQRGGRGDALQNYVGQNRNSELLLQVKYENTRRYFGFDDLQKKMRTTVTLNDPSTGRSHMYEGVRIEDLVPDGVLSHESGSLEISAKHKKTVTILCSNIEFKAPPIVADTIDGKRLTGYVPYYFVVQGHQGFSGSLHNVSLVEVRPSRSLR